MTDVRDVLSDTARRLAAAGIESPRAEARMLLASALGLRPDDLVAGRDITVPPQFAADVERRLAREPIAYITGEREFWSRSFVVGPGALIPRPETETLIEQVLEAFPDRSVALRVLDLGSGSGCLAITLLCEYPHATAVAVDQSPVALSWVKRNAEKFDVTRRLELACTNWTDGITGTFDLVISNPPYIERDVVPALEPDVAKYEPIAALDGGVDGLDAYRALASRIAGLLRPGGRAVLELGAGQAAAVCNLFAASGLETVRVAYDLSAIERCLVLAAGAR